MIDSYRNIANSIMYILRKGLDTVESLSAGAARDPNRNIGTIIIIYIFVTFTHSNIDFHKLLMKISGTLHSSLSCYIPRHTYWVRVCRFFTSLSKHKHLEPGNTFTRLNLLPLATISCQNISCSIGMTKSMDFPTKSCQNISSSVGMTKSRALATKSCRNISSSVGMT